MNTTAKHLDGADKHSGSSRNAAHGGNRRHSDLAITRDDAGTYVLTDHQGRELGTLRAPTNAGQGAIQTEHDRTAVSRYGSRRVTAGNENDPIVVLDRDHTHLAGTRGLARWTIRRRWKAYEGVLSRPDASITLRLTPFTGRRCDVEVNGHWDQRDLVVLTACFALLVRRRRDQIIMVTAGH